MTTTDLRAGFAYRPDIDGLRAWAVLSVVIYHAFPGALPGGFIGVDIFFVISGYLISSILLQDMQQNRFRFGDFYARRIRRILPALLMVMLGTYLLGWVALMPGEFAQLGKHIAAAAGFVSNITLWLEAGYFDQSAETKPLLHLWSLAVEEQFYLFAPWLLWLAWRIRSQMLAVLASILAVSFCANVLIINVDPVATFYGLPTRAWELLAGSVLAWLCIRPPQPVASDAVTTPWLHTDASRQILATSGVALLLCGLLLTRPHDAFPGYWAALPVLGATALIAAGPRAWANRWLSHRVFVWFGLISFPLYLWHWPLLAIARVVHGDTPSLAVRGGIVVISIMLAWLTYRLVEQPIRRRPPTVRLSLVLVASMVVLGTVGYVSVLRDGLPGRQVVALNPLLSSGEDGGAGPHVERTCGIAAADIQKLFAECAQDTRPPVRYALLGDSKAASLFPGLIRTSDEAGRWLIMGGNGPNGVPVPLLSEHPDLHTYQRLTRAAVDAITQQPEITTVALVTAIRSIFQLDDGVRGGNVNTYNYDYLEQLAHSPHYARTLDGLSRTIQRFHEAGRHVVLVEDHPALPNPQDCVQRVTAWPALNRILGAGNPDCLVPLDQFVRQTALYQRLLDALRQRFPTGLEIVPVADLLCDTSTAQCGPQRDGRLLYAYTDHISDYAAGLIGARINQRLRDRDAQNR